MRSNIIKALTIILGLSCSTWAANCPPRVTITTETVATIPSNRARTKIGVGEEVKLTLSPSPSSTVTWSVTGQGTLSSTTGNPVTFTAHEQASTPKITVSYDSYSCEVSFNVVVPSSVTLVKTGGQGQASPLGVQMTANWYIGPEDVNFSKLMIAEQTCAANCTGYFTYQQGLTHNPGQDLQVSNTLVAGKGWKCNGYDNISGGTQGAPYSNGIFTWPIPWHYKINGNSYSFKTINHVKFLAIGTDGKATLTLTKSGASNSQKEP